MEHIDDFYAPFETVTSELKIKRSLFIAQISPCGRSEDFRGILTEVGRLHKEANHHCWAYRLAPGADGQEDVSHCSDDGEPAGTAGKPILSAIRQGGLFCACVVVTRYFGGIKLGVRGLIDAYAEAGKTVVNLSGRVLKTRAKKLAVRLPYAAIKEATHAITSCGAVGSPVWSYEAEVSLTAEVRASFAPQAEKALDELANRGLIRSWGWVT
ncbi:hypothetical protein AGMMS49957_01520 [Synergistales bacterium]|nr:hypothetical protein AGMMS49957_01520 [Synergistales bacterium]